MADAVVTGLAFPEGPRWRSGSLYFSDMQSQQVYNWSPDGTLRVVAHIPGKPSGLGFLNDSTLLIASQHDRIVYKVDLEDRAARPVPHCDLSGIATWHLNDMISDNVGRTYVGNYGSDAPPGQDIAPACLALVQRDGSASIVADGLFFPNGMVFRNGGKELVVAETRSTPGRLTVFDVHDDGSLDNRRTLIEFPSEWPDGLTVDSEDGIWVASPFSNEVIRVAAEGIVSDRLPVANPYAVALGGADGRDLFVCAAETWEPERAAVERTGSIQVLRVDIPA